MLLQYFEINFRKVLRKIIYISITVTVKVEICFMMHEIVSLAFVTRHSFSIACSHFVGQTNINSGWLCVCVCTMMPVTIETVGNIKLQNPKLETNKSKYIHTHTQTAQRKHEWQRRTTAHDVTTCEIAPAKM